MAAVLMLAACAAEREAPRDVPDAITLDWGSAVEPPLVNNAPPDEIAIRWRPSLLSDSAVKALADRHCWGSNAHAKLLSERVAGGDEHVAAFVCRPEAS